MWNAHNSKLKFQLYTKLNKVLGFYNGWSFLLRQLLMSNECSTLRPCAANSRGEL